MRDQYHRAGFGHTSEMIVHAGFGLGVEARCRLIQYQYLGRSQIGPRNRQSLPLADR